MKISRSLLPVAVAAGCLLGMGGTTTAASAAPARQPGTGNIAIAAVRNYWVTVKTGNLPRAGTDANIYVKLHGTLGSSGFLPLNVPGRDDFKQGAKDTFGPFVLNDVGRVRSISLRKNNGDEWYAEYVIVKPYNKGAVTCPVNRWYKNPPESYIFTCS